MFKSAISVYSRHFVSLCRNLFFLCVILSSVAEAAIVQDEEYYLADVVVVVGQTGINSRDVQQVIDLYAGDRSSDQELIRLATIVRAFFNLKTVAIKLAPYSNARKTVRIVLIPYTSISSIKVHANADQEILKNKTFDFLVGKPWTTTNRRRLAELIDSAIGEKYVDTYKVRTLESVNREQHSVAVTVEIEGRLTVRSMISIGCPDHFANQITGNPYHRDKLEKSYRSTLLKLRTDGAWSADISYELEPYKKDLKVICSGSELEQKYRLEIRGNQYLTSDEVGEIVTPSPDDPFREVDLKKLEQKLVELYQIEGFLKADVELRIENIGGEKVLTVLIAEGELRLLEELHIEGLTEADEKELRKLMPHTTSKFLQLTSDQSRTLTPRRLAEGIEVAHRYMLDKGHLEAAEPVTKLERLPKGYKLSYLLQPGAQYHWGAAEGTNRLPGMVPEPPSGGQKYSNSSYENWKQLVLSRLKAAGYLQSTLAIDTKVDRQTRQVIPVITGDPANPFFVGHIYMNGVSSGDRDTLLRVVPVSPGEVASGDVITETRRRLYLLGLFRTVEVQWFNPNADYATVDLLIKLVRKNGGELGISAGLNTAEGIDATFFVGHRNLFGSLRSIEARGTILFGYEDLFLNRDFTHPLRAGVLLGFYERWLFGTPLRGRLTGRYEIDTTQQDFDFQLAEGVLGVDYGDPETRLHVFNYQLQTVAKFNILNRVVNPDRIERVGKLVYTLSRSTLDDRFDPGKGTYLRGSIGYADPILASEYRFLRLSGNGAILYPVLDRLTFVASVDAGVLVALDSGGYYPRNEKFRLGGVSSVRGYASDSIGPFTDAGVETGEFVSVGGMRGIAYQLEVRIPVAGNFDLAMFQDGGIAWRTEKNARDAGSGASFGAGILYHSPIGPIRFDYGHKLLNNVIDNTLFAMHFYIGALF